MNVQELRVGNIVNMGTVYSIDQETDHDFRDTVGCIDFMGGIARFDIDKIEPIPLTEEWLLKFGFEESSKSSFDLMLRISAIRLYTRKSTYWYFQLEDIYLGDTNIKYVHQLQNLHLALNGNELTLK